MAAIKPDAVFPVEGAPDWQVLTEDAVWVTSAPKNAVHRLDVKTNQVLAVVTVGKKPCSGLAAGFGSVWVPNCGDKTLSRIDIKTNQVVATLPFGPADSEGGIATSPDSVWMLTDKKGTLSRIDPLTNKVAAEIVVTPNSAACIYAEGAIWITTPEKKLLTRVDPKTNQVTNTIEVGPGPRFLTAGSRFHMDAESGRRHCLPGRRENEQAAREHRSGDSGQRRRNRVRSGPRLGDRVSNSHHRNRSREERRDQTMGRCGRRFDSRRPRLDMAFQSEQSECLATRHRSALAHQRSGI